MKTVSIAVTVKVPEEECWRCKYLSAYERFCYLFYRPTRKDLKPIAACMRARKEAAK